MIQTTWANGYKPPPPMSFTTHGYDESRGRAIQPQEHVKFRQIEAYALFKSHKALTASRVGELLGIETSAACHLLGKMDKLRWTKEYVNGESHKKRVYRSRE